MTTKPLQTTFKKSSHQLHLSTHSYVIPPKRLDLPSPQLQPNIAHILPEHPLTAPIIPEDITQSLARKRQSAPGIDTITYKHLKEAPYSLIQLLAIIYTFIFRTGFLPLQSKTSKTLMLLKPKKRPHSISSYRPIQLTSALCKTLEKILVHRLHLHLDRYNLIPLHQAGFC